MRMMLAIAAVLPLGVTAAQAQQPVTVKSLLAQEFASSVRSLAPPGRASFCRRRRSFSSVTWPQRRARPRSHALVQAVRVTAWLR